ncbi:RICIN domain-containing protein [Streptomyces sp. NPDC051576]|uniref:RICIN domain-containing protein n=1 Tax=Streptomyces sp. NPDC051576 TaxID=3155803 RepID=UPI003447F0E8
MKIRARYVAAMFAVAALVGLSAPGAVAQDQPGVAKRSVSELKPVKSDVAAQVISHIINNNSGKCLVDPGGSTTAGEKLIQWSCNDNYSSQYWSLEDGFTDQNGDDWYHVVNAYSGQCLGVPGASTEAGLQVIQWPCGNWPDHYWHFAEANGLYQIVNYNSRQCLGIPGASKDEGAAVIQWPCGNWADHYWR